MRHWLLVAGIIVSSLLVGIGLVLWFDVARLTWGF